MTRGSQPRSSVRDPRAVIPRGFALIALIALIALARRVFRVPCCDARPE